MVQTILVADDELPIVEVVRDILEDAGYRVIVASNGAEALALLEQHHPDLLVTDHAMPELTGSELIALLHTRPELDLPGILMSALEALPVPPVATFLPKPFMIDALLDAVDASLPTP